MASRTVQRYKYIKLPNVGWRYCKAVFYPNNRVYPSRRGPQKDSIGKLLKRAAMRAGLKVDALGGYSLRAGC